MTKLIKKKRLKTAKEKRADEEHLALFASMIFGLRGGTMKNAMSDTFNEAEDDEKQREVEECISYLSEANLSRDQRYCVNVIVGALRETI